MEELKKEYMLLFNGITDTVRQLEYTIARLKMLQTRAEELYLLETEREERCEERELREEQGAVSPQ